MVEQSQNPSRSEIPKVAMRLVKIECTGNEVSAIGCIPDVVDETIIDWALSWINRKEKQFEGEVYVALNIALPEDFPLEWGVFYFYEPPGQGTYPGESRLT
jgi:hypothetical protein